MRRRITENDGRPAPEELSSSGAGLCLAARIDLRKDWRERDEKGRGLDLREEGRRDGASGMVLAAYFSAGLYPETFTASLPFPELAFILQPPLASLKLVGAQCGGDSLSSEGADAGGEQRPPSLLPSLCPSPLSPPPFALPPFFPALP